MMKVTAAVLSPILHFFWLLLLVCALHMHASTFVLKTADFESQKNGLTSFIEKPTHLESITFSVDVSCSSKELQELTDLYPGKIISSDDLIRAVEYLIKKNKFQTISITQNKVPSGISLQIGLESFWTLAKVKIKGVSIGRDSFAQYYLLAPGDRFDDERHIHSIEQVTQTLIEQGYCNAGVTSSLKRNEKTKSIVVTLHIALGQRFKIGASTIIFESVDADEYIQELKHAFDQSFDARLRKRLYSRTLINKETQWLKDQLNYRGFFHADIQLTESIDRSLGVVNLCLAITVHCPRQFVFFGNQFFSSARLLDQLQVFGSSLNVLPPSVFANEIEQLYHKKGFFTVKITVQGDDEQTIILIDEGVRTRIEEIEFEGNEFFSSSYLIKHFLADILRKNNFDNDRLKQVFNTITTAYQEQGFWDACISSHDIRASSKNGHRLSIIIDEGPRCIIDEIILEAPFKRLLATKDFDVCQEMPCQLARLTAQRTAIEQEASRQSIKIQSIKPQFKRNNSRVVVDWHIHKAAAAGRFGKTVVVGCPALSHEYIARELTFRKGEFFNADAIKQSVLRLKNLDIFDGIQITPGPLDENGQKTMLVKVHEDDPYELRLRAGCGLQQMSTKFTFRSLTYVAGGVFKIKNPFQIADQIRVEADYKRGMHSIVFSYRVPWLGSVPINMHVDGYTIKYLQPGWVETQHNLYAILQQGFLMGLTHQKAWLSIGMNAGIDWMEIETTGQPESHFFNLSLARALNFVPSLLDHYVPYIMAEPTLMVDLTDNKVNPTRGLFTLVTLKTMVPLAHRDVASYFVKLFLQQSVYIPFHPFLLMLGLRVGHIFQRNFSSIMPSERFYLGGANSIRSYQTDGCPPLGIFCNEYGETVFVPQGARSMINGNAEIRFPLHTNLDGALFQDLGALNNTAFTQIKNKDILAGTGFGLRYATPIGPLRFDIAWKWRREDPKIAPFAWYVTFGSVF
jgi:outer membrane protein assembly factor BamA